MFCLVSPGDIGRRNLVIMSSLSKRIRDLSMTSLTAADHGPSKWRCDAWCWVGCRSTITGDTVMGSRFFRRRRQPVTWLTDMRDLVTSSYRACSNLYGSPKTCQSFPQRFDFHLFCNGLLKHPKREDYTVEWRTIILTFITSRPTLHINTGTPPSFLLLDVINYCSIFKILSAAH